MMRNMVMSLFKFQRIKTTRRRAKVARRLAEKLITLGKAGTVTARRRARAVLYDRVSVTNLFKDVAPLFKTRVGGYTRIIPLGLRRGDNASMVFLELTEKKEIEKPSAKKKAKKEEPEEGSSASSKEPKKEAKRPSKADSVKSVKDEARTAKAESAQQDKKTQAEEKAEDKKGFLKNLRGYFKRKSDR